MKQTLLKIGNVMLKIIKITLITALVLLGLHWLGVADADEYIEVNSKPVTKWVYNRR